MYKLVLCLRYLTTRPIGLVSIVSVMLGVGVMIIVNSIMGGFHTKTRERLHGILADMIVESTSASNGFPNPEAVMAKIREVAGDKVVAMTPDVEFFGMLNFQPNGRGAHMSRPVRVVGILPEGRAEVGDFSDYLQNPANQKQPSFELTEKALAWRKEHPEQIDLAEPTPPGCIVGYQIATFRGNDMTSDYHWIREGQEIIVTTVTAGNRPKPTDARFTVTDIFKCDMSEYDSNYVFVPLDMLQKLRVMGDQVTSIQLKLRDYSDAPALKEALQAALPPTYFQIQTWEDKQGPLLQAVKVEVALLNIILFFIIAVAGFGILAIFFMIVVEKTRDIGTLKALGASNRGIMGVFLGYGLALGLVGCLSGTIFGILFTLNINPIEQFLTAKTGYEIFPRDIYYFTDIPAILDAFTVVWINLGALLIAVAASVLPARRAAGMHPVEALRHA